VNDLNITQIIALVIPLLLIEVGLLAFALYDLITRKRVRGGNKWVWGIIIVFLNFIGPIIYFVLGREEE
jgi:Phospholipase_D-nuclease N-terminal